MVCQGCKEKSFGIFKYWGNPFWEFLTAGKIVQTKATPEVAELLESLLPAVTTWTEQELQRIPLVTNNQDQMWYDEFKGQRRLTAGDKLYMVRCGCCSMCCAWSSHSNCVHVCIVRAFITMATENGFMQNHVDGGSLLSLVVVLNDDFIGGNLCISTELDGRLPDWNRQALPKRRNLHQPPHDTSYYLRNVPGHKCSAVNMR